MTVSEQWISSWCMTMYDTPRWKNLWRPDDHPNCCQHWLSSIAWIVWFADQSAFNRRMIRPLKCPCQERHLESDLMTCKGETSDLYTVSYITVNLQSVFCQCILTNAHLVALVNKHGNVPEHLLSLYACPSQKRGFSIGHASFTAGYSSFKV